MPLLTIAIPTFNRHSFLRKTLEALRPQSHENATLVVVDDSSQLPVEPLVREVLEGSGWSFRVIRNSVNIGLCANLLRSFEVAETEWLWLLSDDDTVDPNAIATILRTVNDQPDLLFATYSLPVLPIEREEIHDSIDSFFLALDSIPRVIFTSSAIYNRRKLVPYLFLAYLFVDSGAPQTALLLMAGTAQPRQKLAYLTSEIAAWQPPPVGHGYSIFNAMSQARLLALCNRTIHPHFCKLLVKCVPWPVRLLSNVVRDAAKGRNRDLLANIIDEYCDTYGKFRGGVVGSFWKTPGRLLGHLALRFPDFTMRMLSRVSLLLRRREMIYDSSPVSLNTYERLQETTARKNS